MSALLRVEHVLHVQDMLATSSISNKPKWPCKGGHGCVSVGFRNTYSHWVFAWHGCSSASSQVWFAKASFCLVAKIKGMILGLTKIQIQCFVIPTFLATTERGTANICQHWVIVSWWLLRWLGPLGYFVVFGAFTTNLSPSPKSMRLTRALRSK